jgi:hypothetical protein
MMDGVCRTSEKFLGTEKNTERIETLRRTHEEERGATTKRRRQSRIKEKNYAERSEC